MVFCGLFPIDGEDYPVLRDALEKLKLNDASLFYEPETSKALGFGFRCGFLGLLHMEIIRERLEREFGLDLLATTPNVRYEVELITGEVLVHQQPGGVPRRRDRSRRCANPISTPPSSCPSEYVGPVMELCNDKRGRFVHMEYLTTDRVKLEYDLPLAEIVLDFFDLLKTRSRGYASLDYELKDYEPGDLVRLDIRIAGDVVDALSLIVHDDRAYAIGRGLAEKLRKKIPRQTVRGGHPGGGRQPDHRPGERGAAAQGRDRQVLRRRHHPQAQAAREAEGRQEAHEDGGHRGDPAGGVPGRAGPG